MSADEISYLILCKIFIHFFLVNGKHIVGINLLLFN